MKTGALCAGFFMGEWQNRCRSKDIGIICHHTRVWNYTLIPTALHISDLLNLVKQFSTIEGNKRLHGSKRKAKAHHDVESAELSDWQSHRENQVGKGWVNPSYTGALIRLYLVSGGKNPTP